jgi:hypothetical protein
MTPCAARMRARRRARLTPIVEAFLEPRIADFQ